MKKILIASVVAVAGLLTAKADWLYWQVNDSVSNVESSALYAKVDNSYYYKLATGTATSGSYEYSGESHSNPTFNYENTSYYIELVTYDSTTGTRSLMHSDESFAYSALHIAGSDLISAMTAVQKAVWSGTTYSSGAVPEPTSGLMMLVGMALLGLKRRRA